MMIIQALNEYYERLEKDPNSKIPSFGFSSEKIHFVLVLNKKGELIDIKDLREKEDKKNIPKQLVVPSPGKKTSGIDPNFMWGNTGYVLGSDNKEHKDNDRTYKMFEKFKEFQHSLGDGIEDIGMKATLKFLDFWQPEKAKQLKYWEEMSGMNLVFQLDGEQKYIHEHPNIQKGWIKHFQENQSDYQAFCLVCGQKKPIARLHPSVKGVKNAQSSGASIVSFNLDSFCSYNKEQSFNAPVSEEIAFNYTTALNHLLRYESRKKIQIGNTTVVFWAEDETPIEGFLKDILDPQNNQAEHGDIRRFLEATREGKMPKEIENTQNLRFYILGLSPNASRLSVRFWYVSTVEDISHKIGQHFKDLYIARSYDSEPEFPGMWQLLRETAVLGKSENIPSTLAGAFIFSILSGQRYPTEILTIVLERIRADQKINYFRAALIKAYLVRNVRLKNNEEREVIDVSLDKEEKNIGYRLGRLFTILEKAQKDAIPGANTTIRDRFYGSASATPAIVFPQLLRLSQHHIQKSDFKVSIDKQIGEVLQDIQKFPAHLSLEDQGMFAVGYYHQKQDIYKKIEKKEE